MNVFREFIDLPGTKDQVQEKVSKAGMPDAMVREDAFKRNGEEVHRVYLVRKEDYYVLKSQNEGAWP